MKEIRLASKIISTLVKDRIQYSDRLVVDTVAIVARCGILLVLYWYVFDLNNDVINGTTFIYSAWSIFFYFILSILRLRNISDLIMKDIRSGNVEVLFSKPVSYLLYRVWWQIGSGLYSFFVNAILGIIALAVLVGVPSSMKMGIFLPTAFLAFVCGVILCLIIYSLVGLLAFWIEDVYPVYWMVDKAVMILGGSYLSVALFPNLLYKIAIYSPLGASQFISHTPYESWQTNWFQLIGIQLFWIVILGAVVYFMFGQAKKNVSVNGG